MEPIIEEFTITLKYQVKVDTETGEMTTKCVSRKVDKSNFEVVESKKKKTTKNESSEPKLILENNKYQLTQAAVDLMGVEPDDKIDIKYEKQGKDIIPVIGSDEIFGTKQGNRLTKSLTVACRGNKNEELAKFGSEFTLVPHPNKTGIFILSTGIVNDEIEEPEEEEIDLPDIDLQDLIDNEDADITEVSASMFQL
jgi:hypothetical protein